MVECGPTPLVTCRGQYQFCPQPTLEFGEPRPVKPCTTSTGLLAELAASQRGRRASAGTASKLRLSLNIELIPPNNPRSVLLFGCGFFEGTRFTVDFAGEPKGNQSLWGSPKQTRNRSAPREFGPLEHGACVKIGGTL